MLPTTQHPYANATYGERYDAADHVWACRPFMIFKYPDGSVLLTQMGEYPDSYLVWEELSVSYAAQDALEFSGRNALRFRVHKSRDNTAEPFVLARVLDDHDARGEVVARDGDDRPGAHGEVACGGLAGRPDGGRRREDQERGERADVRRETAGWMAATRRGFRSAGWVASQPSMSTCRRGASGVGSTAKRGRVSTVAPRARSSRTRDSAAP